MFIAGCCYGLLLPIVRTAYDHGFSTPDVMLTQYLVAVIVMGFTCLFFSRHKVSLKDALKLIIMGFSAAGISFFYYHSLRLLSPAASLTLLFQFVWMGLVVQAIRTRKFPKPNALLAVALIIIGAVFATGMLDERITADAIDPLGVVFGLLSAVCYTTFLTLSSFTATSVPAFNRTLFSVTGGLIVASVIAMPAYLDAPMITLDPVLGIALGLIGSCVPTFLISISSPKLPTGLTTIMASSELPAGVLCAALFLGESITLAMGIGVVVVLLGIVVSELDTVLGLVRKTKPEEVS